MPFIYSWDTANLPGWSQRQPAPRQLRNPLVQLCPKLAVAWRCSPAAHTACLHPSPKVLSPPQTPAQRLSSRGAAVAVRLAGRALHRTATIGFSHLAGEEHHPLKHTTVTTVTDTGDRCRTAPPQTNRSDLCVVRSAPLLSGHRSPFSYLALDIEAPASHLATNTSCQACGHVSEPAQMFLPGLKAVELKARVPWNQTVPCWSLGTTAC